MQSWNARVIAGWVLSGLLGVALILSAVMKFLPPSPEMIEGLKKSGLTDWLLIIGIGEVVSTVLFLVPRTAILGLLLLSSYFGGAILAHMSQGDSILVPAIFLVLIWIAGGLRMPFIFQDLLGGPAASAPGGEPPSR